MSKPIIVLGDALSHGGAVSAASPETDILGKPVARVGDPCVCSVHGSTTIATGDPTFLVDGKPVARAGDTTACGATLVPSQSVTGIG